MKAVRVIDKEIFSSPFTVKHNTLGELCLGSQITYSPSFVLDFDECTQSPCGELFVCENTIGSYKCNCRPGYKGKKCDVGRHLSLI